VLGIRCLTCLYLRHGGWHPTISSNVLPADDSKRTTHFPTVSHPLRHRCTPLQVYVSAAIYVRSYMVASVLLAHLKSTPTAEQPIATEQPRTKSDSDQIHQAYLISIVDWALGDGAARSSTILRYTIIYDSEIRDKYSMNSPCCNCTSSSVADELQT
jgi:hypothetical protein